MLTSESNREEIKRFFQQHVPALVERLFNLINKKYAHSLVKMMQRGEAFPPIFGTYKVGEIILYASPVGLQRKYDNFIFENIRPFLIMKDLRTQKRIMVAYTSPDPIIFSTHAISRYKERLGLEANLDFVDVCKNMLHEVGSNIQVVTHMHKIYGSDLSSRTIDIVCSKGAFLGYYSGQTHVSHAETFLSPNELREDQQYLDVNNNSLEMLRQELEHHNKDKGASEGIKVEYNECAPGTTIHAEAFLSPNGISVEQKYPQSNNDIHLEKWKQEYDILKNKIDSHRTKAIAHGDSPEDILIGIKDGQIQLLSEEEKKEGLEKSKELNNNPLFWETQIVYNKLKAIYKSKLEGYA